MTDTATGQGGTGAAPVLPDRTGPRWVLAWAALGVVVTAISVVAWTGWFVSGNATPTSTGADTVPTYMRVSVSIAQFGGLVVAAVFLWFFLVKPWRRDRRVGLDGLFCLVFATILWQDTVLNVFQTQVVFNSAFVNLGSWNPHLPGWISPNARYNPVPLLFYHFYIWGIFGGAVVGGWVMRKVQERRPSISSFRLVALCFSFFLIFEILVEPPLMLLGMWSYPGTISWLTVFRGHYYQFPITELVLMGVLWTAWASLRFFKDDRGRTIAERGIDRVRVSGWRKTGLRYLALVGACNVIILGLYQIPSAIVGLHIDEWPEDIVERSYFSNGICGPGTDYACPGGATPMVLRGSLHLQPEGTLSPGSSSAPRTERDVAHEAEEDAP